MAEDAGAESLARAAVAALDATDGTKKCLKKWGQRLLDKLGKAVKRRGCAGCDR